jgi:hypothetical protein
MRVALTLPPILRRHNKMRIALLFILVLLTGILKGQYPFEKYPALKYKAYNDWKINDRSEAKEKDVQNTLTIPNFYDNSDTLTIQLTSFADHFWDNSVVGIFRNKIEIKKLIENMAFNPAGLDTVRVADVNGDGLLDVKIIVAYMGNGTASLNVKVIYLFQYPDHSFNVISYDDKMGQNETERDFDRDGNYEIITMNLFGYENHSYWLFNLFEYKNDELVNANKKANYPIMIQFLIRENYEITNKISRAKMRDFELRLPDSYERK